MHTYGMTATPEAPAAVAFDEAEGLDTGYSVEDMMPFGNHVSQMSILRIREDEDRFQTVEELVDYAANNEVTIGASGPTKRNMLANLKLAEGTEAEFQYIPYDGGGPTQTALLQEELDVACRSVYNSLDIVEESKCIGVFWEENRWPELTNEAPPINEALGTDIDFGGTVGRYYWFVEAAKLKRTPTSLTTLSSRSTRPLRTRSTSRNWRAATSTNSGSSIIWASKRRWKLTSRITRTTRSSSPCFRNTSNSNQRYTISSTMAESEDKTTTEGDDTYAIGEEVLHRLVLPTAAPILAILYVDSVHGRISWQNLRYPYFVIAVLVMLALSIYTEEIVKTRKEENDHRSLIL